MPRAIWKGHLVVAAVSCPVALYAAASQADRVRFRMVSGKTGHRLRRVFVDGGTGKPVEDDDIVKGYEVEPGNYVHLTPEEIAAAIPDSDRRLTVRRFVPCDAVDTTFFDRPYYIASGSKAGAETFALIHRALSEAGVAALARAVLFRRVRTMLIRASGDALIGSTLNYADEVRPARDAFSDIPALKLQKEMVELARHIISTKSGDFDPKGFDDRYDTALADLVRAKMAGRALPKRAAPKPKAGGDLLEALRKSAGMGKGGAQKKPARARKAGTAARGDAPGARRAG